MNERFNFDTCLQKLFKIQNLIKTFKHDQINLNTMEKTILVDFNQRLDLFVMDSFTRCLNIKKTNSKDQVTTHCAAYFKYTSNKSNSIQNVKKLIVASNKNSDKLKERCHKLMKLIGYELTQFENKLVFQKIKQFKSNVNDFFEILDYKFLNLFETLSYFALNGKQISCELNKNEFLSSGRNVFNEWYSLIEEIDLKKIESNEKLKNAFKDSTLFYFYLNVFFNFMNDYYDFNDCELVICNPNNHNLYGLHCEVNLVAKYLNEIDDLNKYISLSGDSCILCNLVLKNLDLSYFGAKNNMCSSRYWKLPKIDREVLNKQSERINKYYENLNNDLEQILKLINKSDYKMEDKSYHDELPYSDEWIDNQYSYFRMLMSKKHKICLNKIQIFLAEKKTKNLSLNEILNEIKSIFVLFDSNFSKQSLERFLIPQIQKLIQKYIQINDSDRVKKELSKLIVSDSIVFKINSKIDFFYKSEEELKNMSELTEIKHKLTSDEITERITKNKKIKSDNE